EPNDDESAVDFGNPPGGIQSAGPGGAATFASVFNGDSANGNWSLRIRDDEGGDTGSLTSWGFTVSTDSDDVVINGTSGNDEILISYTTSTSGTYFLNGTGVAFSGVSSITVNGLGGNDVLGIDQNGTLAGPVTFNGGNGDDTIHIRESGE